MTRTAVPAADSTRVLGVSNPIAWAAGAYFVAAALYLPWRAMGLGAGASALSVMVYCLEILGFAAVLLALFLAAKRVRRAALAPREALSVDAFVIVDAETRELVRRSLVMASRAQGVGETVLVGLRPRADLMALAESFGVRLIDSAHALSDALSCSQADFALLVSAAHGARADTVTALGGHFRDPHVAFVQSDIEDPRASRSLWTDLILAAPAPLGAVAQEGRDGHRCVLLAGSGAIVRRSALARIGGVAQGRDWALATALRLHKAGYSSAFVGEKLVTHLDAPRSHAFEGARFALAAARVWRAEGVVRGGALTLAQRIAYAGAAFGLASSVRVAGFTLMTILLLWYGLAPVGQFDAAFLTRFALWTGTSLWLCAALERDPKIVRRLFSWAFLAPSPATEHALGVVERARIVPAPRARRAPTWTDRVISALPLVFAGAGALGLARYVVQGHVSAPALAFGLFCAGVGLVLSLVALRDNWRARAERRASERVAAPIAMSLYFPGVGVREVRVLSASPEGVHIAAPLGRDVASGQRMEGRVQIGASEKSVRVRVRHRRAGRADATSQHLELGCLIEWASPQDQDDFVFALYGAARLVEAQAVRADITRPGDSTREWLRRFFPALRLQDRRASAG